MVETVGIDEITQEAGMKEREGGQGWKPEETQPLWKEAQRSRTSEKQVSAAEVKQGSISSQKQSGRGRPRRHSVGASGTTEEGLSGDTGDVGRKS